MLRFQSWRALNRGQLAYCPSQTTDIFKIDNDNPKSTQQVKKCVAKEARDHLNSIHSGMWEIERSIWNGRDERWAADNKALEEKKRLQQSEAKNKVSGADGGGES